MSIDPEMGKFIWHWGSTAVLAIALYFPVFRFVWVKRIRRLEKELARASTEEERHTTKGRTRLIAALISVCFAYLFNTAMFGP
jgi:dolichol kinase